jgi:hypothetical protein
MPITNTTDLFKKIIVLFWTLWWLIALWTDCIGAMSHLGWLQASWAPDSNFPFLMGSLKMYNVPLWGVWFCYLGIIAWLGLSTATFIWAASALHRTKTIWLRRAEIAFIVSLTLWLAFFLADQLIMKFDLEENHMVQGGFQLLSFLALYILP